MLSVDLIASLCRLGLSVFDIVCFIEDDAEEVEGKESAV